MELIIAHDADWQLPARTENYVYECLKQSDEILSGAIYFAFPWASLIDGLARKTELGERLLEELNKLTLELRKHARKRVITACQHIRFKEYYPLFKQAGITDLFASHKELEQSNLGKINLYPLQLFPVQATAEACIELNIDGHTIPSDKRAYDFSFVGAFDSSCYLTKSRKYIFDHLKRSTSIITERANWHYQARVYDEQVYGKKLSAEHSTEEQKNAREYINIIKDSRFTLCPSGSGPNSIRLWEAIELDSIPVILADNLDLPGDKELWDRACVFVHENEDDIKDIPLTLSKIIKDKEIYRGKIKSVRLLKEKLGLNNFVQNILEKVVKTDKLHETKTKQNIIVNCDCLSANDVENWRVLLNKLSNKSIFNMSIKFYSSQKKHAASLEYVEAGEKNYVFDFSKDFSVIFNSKTLSENLLLSVGTIFIHPNSSPEYINASLYPIINDRTSGSFKKWYPECTLITSMFNGDDYKIEFLDNLGSFEKIDDLEVMICRPESRGCEHFDLLDFGRKYTSLVYLWKAEDPGLYDVWNLVVNLSSAPYCSNANIDDKRAPEHVASLVKELIENSECSVASTALRVTDIKGQAWEHSSNEIVWYKPKTAEIYDINKLYKYNENLGRVVSHNIPHCMPVWRTRLHRKHGQFDESRFGPSADWEFWLRCAQANEKFYLLNRDLGLYYRAPQSYWRRNPKAKSHDDSIVLEYFSNKTLRETPLKSKIRSIKLNNLVTAFKSGNLWTSLDVLYHIIRCSNAKTRSEILLLEYLCSKFLYSNLNYLENAARQLEPAANIKDTYYDFVGFFLRGIENQNIDEDFKRKLIKLGNLINTAENELIGSTIKAKIYSSISRSDLERAHLESAYLSDPYGFWCNVNRIYGLQKPLEYFLNNLKRISEVPQLSNFWWLENTKKLYFAPDYSHGNPYQKLLYRAFKYAGVSTIGIRESDCLKLNDSIFERGDVLHIHWINILFKEQTTDTINKTLDGFLDTLTKLKKRGIKVIWTVHNRQNHETLDLDIEYNFRYKLSTLCDAVLLHHPMIKNEIESWLSPNANIEIVEHGLYEEMYKNEIGRNESRQLIGISEESFVISTLGQIREYKNISEKIMAIEKASAYSPNEFTYLIAGKVSCRTTSEAIEKASSVDIRLVNEFITDEQVQLYLNSSDIVLLSYKDILTSGSFFQATTFNRFVLAPNLGNLKYYVADGINGYIYSNTEDLTTLLKRIKYLKIGSMDKTVFPDWPTPHTGKDARLQHSLV